VRQDTEAGQAVSESARDPVRNSEIENCYPAFAEPDQKDGNKQQSQKQDDACGDQHGRLPPSTIGPLRTESSPPLNLRQIAFEASAIADTQV
jgi:hypothetical protein